MKRIFALILALFMIMSLVACGAKAPDENSKVSEHIVYDFKNNVDMSAQELADHLLANEALLFMGMSMPVEEGLLTGFDNFEVKGFDEGVMFGPAIGTIPFIGYVFDLADDTDVDKFMQDIRDNANLRWNICTEADELVVENKGDTVIVIMTPEKFEEEPAGEDGAVYEEEVPVYGEEFSDEFDGEIIE